MNIMPNGCDKGHMKIDLNRDITVFEEISKPLRS